MNATSRALMLAGALVAAVIVAGIVLAIVRRRLLRRDSGSVSGGIPLHELRAMQARGELSDEEFERLRTAALAEWGASPRHGESTISRSDSEKTSRPTPENPPDSTDGR